MATLPAWLPAAIRPRAPTPYVVTLADVVMDWIERARSRRALAGLDERLQRDIAIDRATLQRECRKPFWCP